MLGKYLGKGQVECHCVGFPKGGNYSRGIGDAWYPSKTKVDKISPEIGKNCQKTNETHTFPTHSHYGQPEFFGRKWKEYGRNRGTYAKLGKLAGESQVECHFVGSQGRNYSRGIGDAWYPSKTKGGSCYNHKTNPEIGKKINQWQPNIFLFPLIPTKARTTKLAQKLEKHPKPIKTMFNQWVAERAFV